MVWQEGGRRLVCERVKWKFLFVYLKIHIHVLSLLGVLEAFLKLHVVYLLVENGKIKSVM